MDVGGTDFDRRLLCIQKEIIGPRHEKIRRGQLDKSSEPFSIRAKPFWDLVTAQSVRIIVLKNDLFVHEELFFIIHGTIILFMTICIDEFFVFIM